MHLTGIAFCSGSECERSSYSRVYLIRNDMKHIEVNRPPDEEELFFKNYSLFNTVNAFRWNPQRFIYLYMYLYVNSNSQT